MKKKKKPSENLEERVAYLENYVSKVAAVIDGMYELETRTIGMTQSDAANFLALKSIVMELAAKQGISPKKFKKHFKRRFDFWYDHVLREVEDHSPGLAAAIDLRDAVSPEIDTPYPPLFD